MMILTVLNRSHSLQWHDSDFGPRQVPHRGTHMMIWTVYLESHPLSRYTIKIYLNRIAFHHMINQHCNFILLYQYINISMVINCSVRYTSTEIKLEFMLRKWMKFMILRPSSCESSCESTVRLTHFRDRFPPTYPEIKFQQEFDPNIWNKILKIRHWDPQRTICGTHWSLPCFASPRWQEIRTRSTRAFNSRNHD